LSHFRAACFDVDGLLVDSEPLHYEAERRVLENHGFEFTPEAKAEFVGVPLVDVAKRLAKRYGLPSPEQFHAERTLAFDELIDSRLQLRAGVSELLWRLRTRRVPCAIVSSGERPYVEKVVKRFSLEQHFQVIVTLDDVVEHKPAPEPYLKAAAQIGVTPSVCVGFEDSQTGVASVKGAGMYCVAVPSSATKHTDLSIADEKLESLTDIDDTMFDRLFGGQ
jgi:HAD superfamily hydrolase (TIGR01509 family)